MFGTKKQYKVFSIAVIILGVMLLGISCQTSNKPSNNDSIGLEPPLTGLYWGMTKEEVVKALGVDNDDMEQISTSNGRSIFVLLYDKEVMGHKPKSIQLSFTESYEYEGKTMPQALVGVTIHYTIDKYDTVLKAVTEQYGEPTQLSENGAAWGSKERSTEFVGKEELNIARDLNIAANRINKDSLITSLNEQLKLNTDDSASTSSRSCSLDNPLIDCVNTMTLHQVEQSNETLLSSEAGLALYIKQAREILE
jgi:hypothetical protein